MASETMGFVVFNYIPALSIYFSLLYDVPLLAAVSIQFDRRILGVARATSAIFSLAIGVLLYLQVFSLLTIHGSRNPGDAALISNVFDAVDCYLAVAATMRWAGSEIPEETEFFRVASLFLWLNTLFPAIHNRMIIHHNYIWLDLFLSIPYLVLFVLIWKPRRRNTAKPRSRMARVIQSGSPLFLTIALLVMALVTTRTHFYIGVATAMLSITGYGLLNVLVQSRGRLSEELLLASKASLEELVGVDDLTGIANRWAFDKALDRECARARRTKCPVSLLMIDIDHFKQLNDTQGHQVGDDSLTKVAGALQQALPRIIDVVARYGGEEFAAILPGTDSEGAGEVARRLCQAVVRLGLNHPASQYGCVTVSIGLSTYHGSQQESLTQLIQAADSGLYKAKHLGRNRSEWLSMGAVEV